MSDIRNNLKEIRRRIENASIRAGRDPRSVKLVAVTKKISPALIMEAMEAGQNLFGENYMQEAKEKIRLFAGNADWHFIGHLQSNKAKDAATLFDLIHTVDNLKLAKALNKHAGLAGRILPVLVQVNVGGETQKAGVTPEKAEQLLKAMLELGHLNIKGLMTMPPFLDDPEDVRPFFRTLRQMAEQFADKGYFGPHNSYELSMGMSGDFEVAVEEGATLVRVGTSIFGTRPA